jgi:hypothetical protein
MIGRLLLKVRAARQEERDAEQNEVLQDDHSFMRHPPQRAAIAMVQGYFLVLRWAFSWAAHMRSMSLEVAIFTFEFGAFDAGIGANSFSTRLRKASRFCGEVPCPSKNASRVFLSAL